MSCGCERSALSTEAADQRSRGTRKEKKIIQRYAAVNEALMAAPDKLSKQLTDGHNGRRINIKQTSKHLIYILLVSFLNFPNGGCQFSSRCDAAEQTLQTHVRFQSVRQPESQ